MAARPEDMTVAQLLREVKHLRRIVANYEAAAQAAQVAAPVPNELLTLEEVSEITRLAVATLRWKRSTTSDGPPLFKQGRRLVCWRDDLMAWIAAQQQRDQKAV